MTNPSESVTLEKKNVNFLNFSYVDAQKMIIMSMSVMPLQTFLVSCHY